MTLTRKYIGGLALAVLALASGCATDKGPFGDRTAVLILQHKPKEILDATTAVFTAKGFELAKTTMTEAVFERKAGAWQAMAWGGWSGMEAWERATVSVKDYGGGDYILEADIKLVNDKGDHFFEDTRTMSKRARKPYQEMLDEVQKSLK